MNFYEVLPEGHHGVGGSQYLLARDETEARLKAEQKIRWPVLSMRTAIICENVRPEYQDVLQELFDREVAFNILR